MCMKWIVYLILDGGLVVIIYNCRGLPGLWHTTTGVVSTNRNADAV
jgi:hypothetical protein